MKAHQEKEYHSAVHIQLLCDRQKVEGIIERILQKQIGKIERAGGGRYRPKDLQQQTGDDLSRTSLVQSIELPVTRIPPIKCSDRIQLPVRKRGSKQRKREKNSPAGIGQQPAFESFTPGSVQEHRLACGIDHYRQA